MTDHRLSDVSAVSILAEELDRIEVRGDYELDSISRVSTTAPSLHTNLKDEDEQHLLSSDRSENDQISSTLSPPVPHAHGTKSGHEKLAEVREVMSRYDLTKSDAREKFKTFITSSGPVTRLDEDSKSPDGQSFRERWQLEGWRYGVFVAMIAVTICLVVEVVMVICSVSLKKPSGGIGVLYESDCAKVKHLDNTLAVILNIIATVLMATSNYVMQCLSAPCRKDIDKAHAAGSYLEIGISSVHNLLHNFSIKSVLWLVLALTNVPIHLMLNSAFFGALQANNYGVMIATTGFEKSNVLSDIYPNDFYFNYTGSRSFLGYPLASTFSSSWTRAASTSNLQNLSRDDCFKRYSNQLQTTTSNVVLVTKQDSRNYSLIPDKVISYAETEQHADPISTFDLPNGVGLYVNPYTGNAIPVLDSHYNWTYPVLSQNASGGIYLMSDEPVRDVRSVRSVFSSFDYHYWTTIKELNYDFNNSDILRARLFNPTGWMCPTADVLKGQTCTSGKSPKAPDPWLVTPQNYSVDYCISQEVEESCSLQYSLIILLIVIGYDLAKIAAMFLTFFKVRDVPLATLGDAIASFLERPDAHTQNCCLLEQNQARQLTRTNSWHWPSWKSGFRYRYKHANTFSQKMSMASTIWTSVKARWFSAASKSRWIVFAILYLFLFSLSIAVLCIGIRDLSQLGIDTPFNQGFGSINPNTVFTYQSGFLSFANNGTYTVSQTSKTRALFADVATVNTPQLLFSSLYFLYNGLFTSMVTAAEWTQFAAIRKALRVSKSKIGQRSTYWLQLPWKYSLPLLIISITLHWLVSRSLFLVRISVFDFSGVEERDRDISACGYSPLAILIVIIVVALSLVVIIGMGFQKLTPGIPVCGTNSVAIAAACHYHGEFDSNVLCKPLLWGVTKEGHESLPGHCNISDRHVDKPVAGMMYR